MSLKAVPVEALDRLRQAISDDEGAEQPATATTLAAVALLGHTDAVEPLPDPGPVDDGQPRPVTYDEFIAWLTLHGQTIEDLMAISYLKPIREDSPILVEFTRCIRVHGQKIAVQADDGRHMPATARVPVELLRLP